MNDLDEADDGSASHPLPQSGRTLLGPDRHCVLSGRCDPRARGRAGAAGTARSSDDRLNLDLSVPAEMGGDGGLIALDAQGNRADPFNSQGMKRAWLTPDGEIGVEVFGK